MPASAKRVSPVLVLACLVAGGLCVASALRWWRGHGKNAGSGHRIQADVAVIAPSDRLAVSMTNLPPAVSIPRQAPESAGIMRFSDRAASIADRLAAVTSGAFFDLHGAGDRATVVAILRDASDEDTVRNEAANLLRRVAHAGLADDLLAVLGNPAERERFRSFAAQHLALVWDQAVKAGDSASATRLREHLSILLNDRHPAVRREVLLALARRRDPQAVPEVRKRFADPAAGEERDLCIRLLVELDLRDALPSVRPFARAEDETIRIAAIVALAAWRDGESRAAFQDAAVSTVERIRRAGTEALKTLDGTP